jgi:hypothetical protein
LVRKHAAGANLGKATINAFNDRQLARDGIGDCFARQTGFRALECFTAAQGAFLHALCTCWHDSSAQK